MLQRMKQSLAFALRLIEAGDDGVQPSDASATSPEEPTITYVKLQATVITVLFRICGVLGRFTLPGSLITQSEVPNRVATLHEFAPQG
jgi:hypothetical protein